MRDGDNTYGTIVPKRGQISIVGDGKLTYLWIGNSICFGHISGKKTLETLAKNILKVIA